MEQILLLVERWEQKHLQIEVVRLIARLNND